LLLLIEFLALKIIISCIYVYHLIQEYFLSFESGNPQLAH
jgi:hypothetical protein